MTGFCQFPRGRPWGPGLFLLTLVSPVSGAVPDREQVFNEHSWDDCSDGMARLQIDAHSAFNI